MPGYQEQRMTAWWMALAVAAFAVPSVLFADLSENTILQTNTGLNLDTGAIVSSGGDILWDGNALTPQGSAKLGKPSHVGGMGFNALPKSYWMQVAPGAKPNPIAADLLVPGAVFVAVTNGGNVAKVLITANSSGVISLQFTTFGVSAPPGVPQITQVLNGSSAIPLGSPNYGIAPSSLFAVVGSGLADPGGPVLQSSAPPGLPLTLNGASITVVVNGVTTHPALYYTSPTQLAGVLPAATPPGTGTLTVTYKGNTSVPTPIQVLPSVIGLNNYSGGLGVATDAVTGKLLTLTNSGTPGEKISIWGTGLGADPADSDTTYTLTPHKVNTPLQVYIGGVPAKILYQGASVYPGVNLINVVIPASVPTGCWVSVAAVTGDAVSNVVTLAISNGGGECLDAQTGLKGSQLSPSGGKTLRTGLLALIRSTSPPSKSNPGLETTTDAAFIKYTGVYTPQNTVSPGNCIVGIKPVPVPGLTGLDPGTIKLTPPSGSPVTLASQFGIKGAFYAMLPTDAFPPTGGSFTFTGSGGADVGPFSTTIDLSNPLLTWTNQSNAATIDRSNGLHVTWTGGNPGTYVVISGSSESALSGFVSYTCLAPVGDGQFTVPSHILLGLPAGKGGTLMQNNVDSPLTASGLDIGVVLADVSFSVASVYQ